MSRFATDIRTVPNMLTLGRIVFLGVGAAFYFSGSKGLGLLIGIVAGATDYADGIIARRTGQVTYLGAILDQFSDLVMEALCILIIIYDPKGFHSVWLFVYLFREFWVSTIRRFMIAHRIDIKSSFLGKLKTNFLNWSFVFWFAYIAELAPAADMVFLVLANTGLYGGLLWAYVSAWQYTRQFIDGYNTLEAAD